MESGWALLTFSLCGRRTDGERAEEMTISSCSKNWEWVGMKWLWGRVNTGWS